MKWLKLIDFESDVIAEGFVIRAYLSYLADFADLLVFSPNEPGHGVGLVYVTSFHAGQVCVVFPEDSAPEGRLALSRNWLATNWTKWVDQGGDVSKAYVSERYPDATEPVCTNEDTDSRQIADKP